MSRNASSRRRFGGVFHASMLGFALCLAAPAASAGDFAAPLTVDLESYAGDWFEIARAPNDFQDDTLRRDGRRFGPCFATRVSYEVVAPDEIRVSNRCRRRAPDGATLEEDADGVAIPEAGADGRKLRLAFGGGAFRFAQRMLTGGGFDYWIYCLGPRGADGRYAWSVVSDSDKDFLFILARTPRISDATLETVLSCARAEGLPVETLIYRQEAS